MNGACVVLKQFHYVLWPDFGVPDQPLPMLKLTMMIRDMNPTMMIVHCSAGVGRTGTFIEMLRLIHRVETRHGDLDIFNTVLTLRQDRRFLVTII